MDTEGIDSSICIALSFVSLVTPLELLPCIVLHQIRIVVVVEMERIWMEVVTCQHSKILFNASAKFVA